MPARLNSLEIVREKGLCRVSFVVATFASNSVTASNAHAKPAVAARH